ncbi:aldo/keto reductase [Benzoatithermus flavus]|uniref:Aldo/keto reductase n=1 Tax=Benzoatithermus flavus TaxID=3108223 RepID=A0ABU8XRR3_9PROT
MQRRRLGRNGPDVSAIGLGCMGMSWAYGPADETESIATIHAAMAAGIDLLDTGDFYGIGHNEELIGRAIRGRRDEVFIAVKFGALRDPSGGLIGFDARPASVRNFLSYTLRRLGTDHVDLYQPARVDPAVPIEDTVGTIADLIRAGYVRHLGLSEAGAGTIRRAHAVHPVAQLQIEYSLMTRGIEAAILPTCRELGIGVTAYGVLSRGLLSGRLAAGTTLGADDFRTRAPRFQGENLARNLELVEALRRIAVEKGATPAQLAIAWVLSRGEDIVPLVGARRRDRLEEALGALDLVLDADDLVRIEAAVPAGAVAGTRYDAHGMRMLDSEGRPGG